MREKFPVLSVNDFEKNKEKVLSIIDIIADITSSKTGSNYEFFL